MPETGNIPENNKAPEDESDNKAETPESNSTDDYFEKVNLRLKDKKKEKSRFNFNRQSKKIPPAQEEPPPKAEPPVEESKIELPPAETSKEIPSIEATPAEQQPSVEITEPQPAMETIEQPFPAESIPLIAESESKPQPIEEVKPKKRSFFSFFSLRRKPKAPQADKMPPTGNSTDMPPSESVQPSSLEIDSQLQAVMVDSEKQPEVIPATSQEAPVNPLEATSVIQQVNAPDESQPEKTPAIPEAAPSEAVSAVPLVEYSEGVENIGKYAQDLKSLLPKKAVVCIGEYPIHLLLKSRFAGKPEGILPLFIDKSSLDIAKWSQAQLNPEYIIGLDAELDTHFWFNIVPNVTGDSAFIARLKSKPIEKLCDAIMVASIWDGVGSALLPTMIAQFNEWKINSVAVAFLPSKVQPLESQFNAFAAVGKCASLSAASLVLIDRDNIESYIGVDRRGSMINGNVVANYLLDFMLSKETLVAELGELSKTFDSKLYTLLFATGASLKIYGSIQNILDTTLFKPFLTFDLSSASLLYVLIRMPYHLKDKLPRGKVEMAVASWFKDKAALKSIHVAEPVYVEDTSDRVDIALFVGGFDTAKMFSAIEKKVNAMKNQAVKNGFLKESEWKEIVKNLTG